MKVSTATLLPLLAKLGDYFKLGLNHYAAAKATGADTDPDTLAGFIGMQMAGWNPKIRGREVLDDEIKEAGARLLAGLIINLAD